MDKYGEFSASVSRLNDGLEEVRNVWNDDTAKSYGSFNENMEQFTCCIWNYYNNSVSGYEAVKANYSESECDSELDILNSKVLSV